MPASKSYIPLWVGAEVSRTYKGQYPGDISEEYSTEYKAGMEPYYPVNDERNNTLAAQYRALATQEADVIFGGRLAEYKYYDMAPIIEQVMKMYK